MNPNLKKKDNPQNKKSNHLKIDKWLPDKPYLAILLEIGVINYV